MIKHSLFCSLDTLVYYTATLVHHLFTRSAETETSKTSYKTPLLQLTVSRQTIRKWTCPQFVQRQRHTKWAVSGCCVLDEWYQRKTELSQTPRHTKPEQYKLEPLVLFVVNKNMSVYLKSGMYGLTPCLTTVISGWCRQQLTNGINFLLSGYVRSEWGQNPKLEDGLSFLAHSPTWYECGVTIPAWGKPNANYSTFPVFSSELSVMFPRMLAWWLWKRELWTSSVLYLKVFFFWLNIMAWRYVKRQKCRF